MQPGQISFGGTLLYTTGMGCPYCGVQDSIVPMWLWSQMLQEVEAGAFCSAE